MRSPRTLAPLLLLGLLAQPAAAGTVYKWKDASGQVHYTQTPPPEGAVREPVQRSAQADVQPGVTLNAPNPPAAPAKAATAPGEKAAAPIETAEAKATRCAQARERLSFLEERTAYRLMVEQPDGSSARMTEEEFQQRLGKAREAGKGC